MAETNQPEKLSPAELQKFLKGADYPADKEELLECAQNNDAPEEVVNFLERIPDQEYSSPIEVSKELGEEE